MFYADLDEPDRRLDALIDIIEGEAEPGLGGWAVEALAEGLGVDAVVLQGDALQRLQALSYALGAEIRALPQVQLIENTIIRVVTEGLRSGIAEGHLLNPPGWPD